MTMMTLTLDLRTTMTLMTLDLMTMMTTMLLVLRLLLVLGFRPEDDEDEVEAEVLVVKKDSTEKTIDLYIT